MSKGLPPGGATVSPEVPDDLFQAHRSLYLYAARFAAGRQVLDLGCGTGYGAPELLGGGAASVLGIDRDPACIRYARRKLSREPAHEPGNRARFEVADPGAPAPGLGTFGLVLALGLLPRLVDPGRTLDLIRDLLEPGGTLIVSLPPILDGQALALHQARPGQLSNLYLWDWEAELTSRFSSARARVRLVRHLPPPGSLPDFGNPRRSALDPSAFRFEEIPLSEIYGAGNLTALFVCQV